MAATFEVEATPDYWLIILLRAIRSSDLDLAAEAQHRLRALGIEIKFGNLLRDSTTSTPEAPSCR